MVETSFLPALSTAVATDDVALGALKMWRVGLSSQMCTFPIILINFNFNSHLWPAVSIWVIILYAKSRVCQSEAGDGFYQLYLKPTPSLCFHTWVPFWFLFSHTATWPSSKTIPLLKKKKRSQAEKWANISSIKVGKHHRQNLWLFN